MSVINKKFSPPALPLPSLEYDQRQQDQFQSALRLYLRQLDGYLADLTNLLNTGVAFDNIDANTINVGTLAATNTSTFNLNATNTDSDLVSANRFMGGNAVLGNVMSANFYGGYFYGNGRYLSTPYNQFQSLVDQTAGAIDQAYALKLEVTDFADGIFISGVNNDTINFSQSGVYTITYSLSFKNTTNDAQDIDVWIRYNGTDFPNSNTKFSIPARKSTGSPSYLVAVTPIMGLAANNGDYIQIMWRVSDINVTLEYLPAVTYSAGVTPAIPATPSAIVQATFNSAEFPPITRVAPLGVLGSAQIGEVSVVASGTP